MKLFNILDTAFNSFDDTVNVYLSKTLESLGDKYSHGQIFKVIFDGVKGVMQNAMFYIEDALVEQNVYTAARKKSIYSLAKLSGYEAYYGSAAVGIIKGNVVINNGLTNNISTKINIMNYSKVVDKATGMTYMIMLDTNKYVIDINAPLTTHEFKIVQGEYITTFYTASGEALEKVSVDVNGLFDRDYISVYVNGERWQCVSSLYDMTSGSKECILTVGYENSFDIMFGNGVYGKIPAYGDSIEVKFIKHNGSNGNISTPMLSKFEFVTPGYDSYGNNVNLNKYMQLKLANVVSGGTDADSIDFVRSMIGYNSRSNVIASEENFILFFKRFSFIGQINVWAERNSMTIMATCTSNVVENLSEINKYYELTEKDFLLTNKQKDMIVNTLENSKKTFAGISLKFQDPLIRKFAIFCYIKTSSIYAKKTIEEDVKYIFAKYFMNLKDNTQFIPKSDLVNLGSTCNENIESFDIDIISAANEEAYYNGYYETYVMEKIDDTYVYVKKTVFNESDKCPGLDIAGNISLDTKLEIPVLMGGFPYYAEKDDSSKDSRDRINIDAVNFFFI
jgi:hypothetical protein